MSFFQRVCTSTSCFCPLFKVSGSLFYFACLLMWATLPTGWTSHLGRLSIWFTSLVGCWSNYMGHILRVTFCVSHFSVAHYVCHTLCITFCVLHSHSHCVSHFERVTSCGSHHVALMCFFRVKSFIGVVLLHLLL